MNGGSTFSKSLGSEPGNTWALVPAAGEGRRFSDTESSSGQDKLLVELGEIPVLIRTLHMLCMAIKIDGILIVAHPERRHNYAKLINEHVFSKPVAFADGGATRRDSVYNGLKALPDHVSVVAIHDAARPFVDPDVVDNSVRLVEQGADGAVVGLPILDTVKQVSGPGAMDITGTLDRRLLWRVQTPQVFPKALILQAHCAVSRSAQVTDDAQILEKSGLGVAQLVQGLQWNIKITRPDDLKLGERLIALSKPVLST